MSISSNRKLEETSFLSKSNSTFIEQMYLKYLNKDANLSAEWKTYFEKLNEETFQKSGSIFLFAKLSHESFHGR